MNDATLLVLGFWLGYGLARFLSHRSYNRLISEVVTAIREDAQAREYVKDGMVYRRGDEG